jgi:DNA polymerase I-like protein with 3'-5' exonuclease and polymerase domains
MNQCNEPDHGAINAERAESRGLRKAWVELDDKRQDLEKQLSTITEQRDKLAGEREQWRMSSVCRELEEKLAKAKAKLEEVGFRACCVLLERDEAREQRDRLAEALREIADCDFVITLPDRMDAVRAIAREALGDIKWHKL